MVKRRIIRALAAASAAACIASAVSVGGVAGAAPRVRAVTPAYAASPFTLLGTVDQAAAQPTVDGRRIESLAYFNDRLYAGYGDWNSNTGPITVQSIGSGDTAFRSDFVVDTEAIEVMRPVGAKLVVPATDPRNDTEAYAAAEPWVHGKALGATHVFDAGTLTGEDLWLVGSRGANAVAWRSLDGGETWTESLVAPPADPQSWARFHFAGILGGKLYVQPFTASVGADRRSYVFDGAAWSRGPALVQGVETGHKPQRVGGKLLLTTWGGDAVTALRSFDGRKSAIELTNVVDVAVRGGEAFALLSNGTVMHSRDLSGWAPIGQAPAGSSSIAASSTSVAVGTQASEVWVRPL